MKVAFLQAALPGPSLLETVREEAHAAGPVQRQWLHNRVRQRSGLSREEVAEAVDNLLRAGDLLSGHGLVGPAPLRYVPLPGGNALLIGARPARFLDGEPLSGLPRRVRTAPPGAIEVSIERWTGLDRAPRADKAFLASLAARDPEIGPEDWTEAYSWRDGRFRQCSVPEGLLRLRMPGYWFRYAWVDRLGRRTLTSDEGLRASFALAREAGGTTVPCASDAREISVRLPRLPRAEYRFIFACGLLGADYTWRVPCTGWAQVQDVLGRQLGISFEETDGQA